MENSDLKIMLSFMREVNNGNVPTSKDYDLSYESFCNIIELCQDKGFIKDAKFKKDAHGKNILAVTNNVKLTYDGLEYLKNNSALMKAYKGLKEIKSWLSM